MLLIKGVEKGSKISVFLASEDALAQPSLSSYFNLFVITIGVECISMAVRIVFVNTELLVSAVKIEPTPNSGEQVAFFNIVIIVSDSDKFLVEVDETGEGAAGRLLFEVGALRIVSEGRAIFKSEFINGSAFCNFVEGIQSNDLVRRGS